MEIWWQSVPALERALFLIGMPFTLILVIQTVLLLFGHGDSGDLDSDTSGLDLDSDLDGPEGLDLNGDLDGSGLDGVDHGLRIFSIRGIVGFFAVGCWAGIACLENGLGSAPSLLAALAAGAVTMVAIAAILRAMGRLQENGTMDLRSALGRTATVYIPIPASRGGTGKVTLVLSDSFTELEAVTDGEALQTGASVRVTDILDGRLVVEPW